MSAATGSMSLRDLSGGGTDGCERCAARLVATLGTLRGIVEVRPGDSAARIKYTYDPALLTPSQVEDLARDALAEIDARYAHEVLAIEGMDCADCALKVERGVGKLAGVENAAVNLLGARLDVEYDRSLLNREGIEDRVRNLGYEVSSGVRGLDSESSAIRSLLGKRQNVLAMVAALLTLAGIGLMIAGAGAQLIPFVAAAVIGGTPIAIKGLRTLRTTRSFDINLLMAIAIVGAVAIGEYLEAAIVVVLFAVSEALESYAMDRTRRSIRSLMNIAPNHALVVRDGQEIDLPVEAVGPGDTVVIRPGQRIPLDGVVIAGASDVNQAALTGESMPATKLEGDELYAGTLNGAGPLTMRVTRTAADSSVARIIQLVEQAESNRAPVQRLVDRFAAYYTPAVVLVAVAVATVPPLLGADFLTWFYRALILLVIACPCALVLSTPVSILSALTAATRRGILIKGGSALERAATIDTIAFDKTGTLTRGEPRVFAVHGQAGWQDETALATAAAMERHAQHPLAAAIVEAADERGLAGGDVTDERTVAGAGLVAAIDGHEYRLGSQRLFAPELLTADVLATIDEVERAGGTTVLLGDDDAIHGVIGLTDTIRDEARAVARQLHESGIKRLVMLTGDRPAAAHAIAAHVGIDDVRAELMPGEKVAAVEDLKRGGGIVAMVGDGVNDAPALVTADLGIAMGAAGSDTALETADIALMGDDLGGISRAIAIGKRARRVIAANITFAIATKALFFTLALGGVATLWMAVFADVGTSLLVIANALRLLRD